jgi:hypothetical protein
MSVDADRIDGDSTLKYIKWVFRNRALVRSRRSPSLLEDNPDVIGSQKAKVS